MAETSDPKRTPKPDPLLAEIWQQLMGFVLEQRFRWAEVASELGITQAGLRALLAIDPDRPPPPPTAVSRQSYSPAVVLRRWAPRATGSLPCHLNWPS